MKRQATELENLAIHMANNGVNQKNRGNAYKSRREGKTQWKYELES